MLAIVMVAFGGILPSRAAPTPPPDDLDSTADAVGEKTILPGDALVSNHSFEAGLDGWTQTDGYGDEAGQRCGEALTTIQEWSSDGDASLLLDGARGCPKVGAMSDEVEVEPGQQYTVWADVHDGKVSWAGLQWIGADGEVLESEHTRRNARSDRLELTATAPETATGVRVEIGAIGQTKVDKVLLSGQYTDLGAQVTQRPRFLSSEAGTDENGRDVIWAMATGSEEDPGILMATDVLTGEITRAVRLPGATGGWGVNQNPVTGTVYVGTYGAGALWLYTPGEDEAVNAGAPDIPAWDFGYNVAFDEEGNAYGGGWGEPTAGYPGASVYTYTEGEGFTGTLGEMPLTDTANYTRSLVYDEASRTVFVGTGTQVNLFGCSIDTDECEDLTDLLSPEIQDSVEVRRMVASEGYVLAWAGDGGSWGNDWLIVLDVERSAAGDLEVEVVDEIKGVAFPGSSPVVEDHVYYTKAGYEGWPLFRYNVVTGEETQLPKDVEILARQWDVIELDDPQWPGPTLVGLDSYGSLARYNIETETMDVQSVPDVPEVSLRINSIATGPDGSLWSSGYLHGGIGHYTPMRDDEQETFNVGGQAEQMTAHDGRMFQGTYPNGTITSFTEAQLRNGEAPTLECEIGAGQNRPYGLYSSGDRLYFGSQAGDQQDVGAFGWFDAETGECTTIEGPLGHQSINALTGSGERIFGGGNIFFGYTHEPILDEASVMVFDEGTEDITEVGVEIPGIRAVNAATTAADGTVWFYAEGWLLAMDPDTLEWIHAEEVFPDHKPGNRIGGSYARMLTAEDGTIYGTAGGRVFSVDPELSLRQGSAADHLEILYENASSQHLALDDYGNVYVRHGATGLLRIVPDDH